MMVAAPNSPQTAELSVTGFESWLYVTGCALIES